MVIRVSGDLVIRVARLGHSNNQITKYPIHQFLIIRLKLYPQEIALFGIIHFKIRILTVTNDVGQGDFQIMDGENVFGRTVCLKDKMD